MQLRTQIGLKILRKTSISKKMVQELEVRPHLTQVTQWTGIAWIEFHTVKVWVPRKLRWIQTAEIHPACTAPDSKHSRTPPEVRSSIRINLESIERLKTIRWIVPGVSSLLIHMVVDIAILEARIEHPRELVEESLPRTISSKWRRCTLKTSIRARESRISYSLTKAWIGTSWRAYPMLASLSTSLEWMRSCKGLWQVAWHKSRN